MIAQKDSSPQFKLMGGDSLTGSWEHTCVSNEDDDYQLQISFSSDKFFKNKKNIHESRLRRAGSCH